MVAHQPGRGDQVPGGPHRLLRSAGGGRGARGEAELSEGTQEQAGPLSGRGQSSPSLSAVIVGHSVINSNNNNEEL